MIIIVGLGLAAVLAVVIPLGSSNDPDWLIVALSSLAMLTVAGILLYFWIVVLELFIRIGNTQQFMANAAFAYPAPQMQPMAYYQPQPYPVAGYYPQQPMAAPPQQQAIQYVS